MSTPLKFFEDLVIGSAIVDMSTEFRMSDYYNSDIDAIVLKGETYSNESEMLEEYNYTITFKDFFDGKINENINRSIDWLAQESYRLTSKDHVFIFYNHILLQIENLLNEEKRKEKSDELILNALESFKSRFKYKFIALNQLSQGEKPETPKLKFSLNQNEIITLFAILHTLGMINEDVKKNHIANFLENNCLYNTGDNSYTEPKNTIQLMGKIGRENGIQLNAIAEFSKRFSQYKTRDLTSLWKINISQ